MTCAKGSKNLRNKSLVYLSQDLNERERNLDKQILESSNNLDEKYSDLQVKISEDIRLVTERENNLEIKLNDIKDLEVSISKESQILMTKKEMYL
jgi:uncharacterized protein YaeQ